MVEEEEKPSKFNAGILQTLRVDKHIQLIHFCNKNPYIKNEDYLEYNYIVRLNAIKDLHSELIGNIKPDEDKELSAMKKINDKLIEEFPIYSLDSSDDEYKNEKKKLINNAADIYFRRVMKLGFHYQVFGAYKHQAGRI